MLAAAAAVLYPVCVSWLWRHQAMVLPLTATGNGGAHGRTWIVYNMCIVYRGAIRQTFCVLVIIRILFYYLFIVYFVLPHPAIFSSPVRGTLRGVSLRPVCHVSSVAHLRYSQPLSYDWGGGGNQNV